MAVTISSRRPKDLYEDWASSLDTLWSIKTWQEAEQQKNKNKQKKKSSEIDVSTISSVVNDYDKFTTIRDSVDIAVDRITILENRVSAVEEELENRVSTVEAELQHKPKKRKIKIKIRG